MRSTGTRTDTRPAPGRARGKPPAATPEPRAFEHRRYFRVWTRLVLRYRRVEPAECERLEEELRSRTPEPAWTGDPALGHWLARIESKLDRLLERVDAGAPRPTWESADARGSTGLIGADLRHVELSGSGLRFVADGPLAPGDEVLVELWIPGSAARRVRSLARVVRNAGPERPGGPPSVALAFRVLAEDDRDAIVRHSLDVQRLARRSGGEDPRP